MTGAKVKDLASLSRRLNEASDILSRQIAQVEAAINELKLGVWAWVTVSKYEADSDFTVGGKSDTVTKVESLGYGKHQGKWCLLFATSYEEYPDPRLETVIPLRDAPRMERIQAVEKLPELIQALEAKAKDMAQLATTRAGQVAEVAAALKAVAH